MVFWHKRPCSTNRNLASGYKTLLLQLILGDLYSACPNKQDFITKLIPKQGGSLYHLTFMMIYGMIHPMRKPHERPTCQPLDKKAQGQPINVLSID